MASDSSGVVRGPEPEPVAVNPPEPGIALPERRTYRVRKVCEAVGARVDPAVVRGHYPEIHPFATITDSTNPDPTRALAIVDPSANPVARFLGC